LLQQKLSEALADDTDRLQELQENHASFPVGVLLWMQRDFWAESANREEAAGQARTFLSLRPRKRRKSLYPE